MTVTHGEHVFLDLLHEKLEIEIAEISQQMSDPDFFKGARDQVQKTENRLSEQQKQLSHCYERWEILENQ